MISSRKPPHRPRRITCIKVTYPKLKWPSNFRDKNKSTCPVRGNGVKIYLLLHEILMLPSRRTNVRCVQEYIYVDVGMVCKFSGLPGHHVGCTFTRVHICDIFTCSRFLYTQFHFFLNYVYRVFFLIYHRRPKTSTSPYYIIQRN